MLVKFIIGFLLLASIILLVCAIKPLFSGSSTRTAMAKQLTMRMICSAVAFIILITAYYLGWIHPHPLGQ